MNTIANRVGRLFPLHTMLHGFAIHANGLVKIHRCSNGLVEARVRSKVKGSRAEVVRLEAKAGRLIAGCSCPARDLGITYCKHMWSVVLEADLQGHLDDLKESLRPLRVDSVGVEWTRQRRAKRRSNKAKERP
jgi:uncharacterized Zn finger protein